MLTIRRKNGQRNKPPQAKAIKPKFQSYPNGLNVSQPRQGSNKQLLGSEHGPSAMWRMGRHTVEVGNMREGRRGNRRGENGVLVSMLYPLADCLRIFIMVKWHIPV